MLVLNDFDFTDLPLTNSCGIRLDVCTVGECQYIVSRYVNMSHLHAYAERQHLQRNINRMLRPPHSFGLAGDFRDLDAKPFTWQRSRFVGYS